VQPQRLADLVVFSVDPITCPIDRLLAVRPAFTMVGGRAIYDPQGRLGEQAS
jgi:predicted amidohydrolase YtcJ